MSFRRLHGRVARRLAAFVLGPLVALQLLLAGIVAVQMAAQPPLDRSVMCYGAGLPADDAGEDDAGSVRHSACVLCIFAKLAPLVAGNGGHLLLRDAYACLPAETPPPLVALNPIHNPRTSQGPPPAA